MSVNITQYIRIKIDENRSDSLTDVSTAVNPPPPQKENPVVKKLGVATIPSYTYSKTL